MVVLPDRFVELVSFLNLHFWILENAVYFQIEWWAACWWQLCYIWRAVSLAFSHGWRKTKWFDQFGPAIFATTQVFRWASSRYDNSKYLFWSMFVGTISKHTFVLLNLIHSLFLRPSCHSPTHGALCLSPVLPHYVDISRVGAPLVQFACQIVSRCRCQVSDTIVLLYYSLRVYYLDSSMAQFDCLSQVRDKVCQSDIVCRWFGGIEGRQSREVRCNDRNCKAQCARSDRQVG